MFLWLHVWDWKCLDGIVTGTAFGSSVSPTRHPAHRRGAAVAYPGSTSTSLCGKMLGAAGGQQCSSLTAVRR